MPRHTPRILAENRPEIGADRAVSHVLAGKLSPCAVIEEADTRRVVAVLPSELEAARVARYAISSNGGYGSVTVEESTEVVTHSTFEAWLSRS